MIEIDTSNLSSDELAIIEKNGIRLVVTDVTEALITIAVYDGAGDLLPPMVDIV